MAVRSKKVRQTRKKNERRGKKKLVIRSRIKARRRSKLAVLEEAGLIGCLTGTGVTSKNYKDILHKK